MLTGLMPVLQDTMVTLTISRIDDQLLRVNIIPKHKIDQENSAENGLPTPLTVTATPAELSGLWPAAGQLQPFVPTLRRQHPRDRGGPRRRGESRRGGSKNGKARKSAVPSAKTSSRSDNERNAAPAAKPVFGGKGQSATAPTTHSLFDNPPGKRKACRESARTLVLPQLSNRVSRKAERAQLMESRS
jgi:hypothetical protein